MSMVVTDIEDRKRKVRDLVEEALALINETNSKLRSSENGKDKKRKQAAS